MLMPLLLWRVSNTSTVMLLTHYSGLGRPVRLPWCHAISRGRRRMLEQRHAIADGRRRRSGSAVGHHRQRRPAPRRRIRSCSPRSIFRPARCRRHPLRNTRPPAIVPQPHDFLALVKRAPQPGILEHVRLPPAAPAPSGTDQVVIVVRQRTGFRILLHGNDGGYRYGRGSDAVDGERFGADGVRTRPSSIGIFGSLSEFEIGVPVCAVALERIDR